MKILALRGENLASIQHRFEIDFTHEALVSSGLFAITGKTGSGKSTLLDAICLALFDKMPRLTSGRKNDAKIGLGDEDTRIGANDVRSILSRGKASAFAEVDFAAMDGSLWRANWSVSRARAKLDGKVKPAEICLINLKGNQHFSGKKQEILQKIEQLIGLNYEQFRRAVMLPQGDFAAFLKAKEDERAALLERMTGNVLYSHISKAAFEKAKAQESVLNRLNDKLGSVKLLSTEEIDELNIKLAENKDRLNTIADRQAMLKKHLETMAQCKSHQASLDSALFEFDQAQLAVTDARPKQNLFELVEKVQPAQEDFKQINSQKNILIELNIQHDKQNNLLNLLEAKWGDAQENVEQNAILLTEKEQAWQQAEPKLRLAAIKDIEIAALQKQINEVDKIKIEQKAKLDDEKSSLAIALQQEENLTKEKLRLTAVLEAQTSFSNIANKFDFVQSNIKAYAKHQSEIRLAQAEIDKLEASLPKLEAQAKQYDTKLDEIEQKQVNIETKLKVSTLESLEKEYQQTQINRDASQEKQENLRRLKEQSTLWLTLLKAKEQSEIEHQKLEQKGARIQKDLDDIAPQLLNTKAKLEEAEQTLKQTQAIADFSYHRATLKDGEACPLCGSAQHPYINEDTEVNSIIETQHQRVKALQQAQQSLISSKSMLVEKTNNNTMSLKKLAKSIEDKNQELEANKTQLKAYLVECNQDVDVTIKLNVEDFSSYLDSINQQISLFQKENKALFEALIVLNKSLANIREWKQTLSELGTQSATYQGQKQEINNERNLAKERLNNYSVLVAKEMSELTTKTEVLNQAFGDESWLKKLEMKGDELYLEELKHKVEDYFALGDLCKQTEFALGKSQHDIEKINLSLTQLENSFTKTAEKLMVLFEELKAQKQARKQIFVHDDLSAFEKVVKQEIASLQESKKQTENELTLITKEKISTASTIASLKTQQQKAKESLQSSLQQWLKWQQDFDLDENRLANLLSYEADWIKKQRQELQALNEEKKLKQALVAERKLRLEQSQKESSQATRWLTDNKVVNEDDFVSLRQELESEYAKKEENIYYFRLCLDANEKAKEESSDLIEKIKQTERDAEVWLKLNALIGSADGKKFRNLAQALTLRNLVEMANQHLKELSPRYELQTVPSSALSLQVMDHDMGDEVRSVESLSGGESFLVSLALALALASLAADTRKLGTLFIDEGFGTLDPESLEMTLACLDALQADGRQIGVISHVTTLVERIGTQIIVEAQGGGVSQIKISA